MRTKATMVIMGILVMSVFSITFASATPEETTDNTTTPTVTSTPVPTATAIPTLGKFRLAPSVSLTSTKNVVEATDPAILTLSMINPSVNDVNLQVDVILKAPSGVYVTATSFASSGSNQNIGHFNIRPGEENHITIQITSTEIGEKAIESQVVYFPEGNKDDYHMLQQTMSVQVNEKSATKPTPIEVESKDSDNTGSDKVNIQAPGFSIIAVLMGLIGGMLLLKGRKSS